MDPSGPGPSSAVGGGGDAPAAVAPQQRPAQLSRYESQKRRDWQTFTRYLGAHRPPLQLRRCSGAHVLEFLRYLDRFGKTRVHAPPCPAYGAGGGARAPPDACQCPLRQAWGSLDALVGRLRRTCATSATRRPGRAASPTAGRRRSGTSSRSRAPARPPPPPQAPSGTAAARARSLTRTARRQWLLRCRCRISIQILLRRRRRRRRTSPACPSSAATTAASLEDLLPTVRLASTCHCCSTRLAS